MDAAKQSRKARGPRRATARYLENASLYYLQRYATSAENLRRVLLRKVERSARAHGTDRAEGAEIVARLIQRFQETGILDDAAYAEARALTLFRRGASPRAIRATLRQKGVDAELIDQALLGLHAEAPEPELASAVTFARRRRLGPFRRAAERQERREKDLAALARAGFSYGIAKRVVNAASCRDLEREAAGRDSG